MNHPESGTAQGIAAAVPQLLASGYRFVRLSDELNPESDRTNVALGRL